MCSRPMHMPLTGMSGGGWWADGLNPVLRDQVAKRHRNQHVHRRRGRRRRWLVSQCCWIISITAVQWDHRLPRARWWKRKHGARPVSQLPPATRECCWRQSVLLHMRASPPCIQTSPLPQPHTHTHARAHSRSKGHGDDCGVIASACSSERELAVPAHLPLVPLSKLQHWGLLRLVPSAHGAC